jgi:ABC-type transport system substrate-binding protein
LAPIGVNRSLITNRDRPPFDNPDLRRAMALSFDRKAFIDIVTAGQGDIGGVMQPSDGFPNNERLFLPPTAFNRFAVTREINDGLLAPRFAPSQRAWVLTGVRVPVSPTVDASTGRDADDR